MLRMRRFENENFSHDLAESINSHLLTVPEDDNEARTALSYIRQFVYVTASNAELHRGYISEDFLDALVRIREESNNRDFNSAVEALGVEGETSTEVTEYDELVSIEVKNTFEAVEDLSSLTREHSNELSDEARKNLYSIRELVEDNRDIVLYYLPREVLGEIMPYLAERDLLL